MKKKKLIIKPDKPKLPDVNMPSEQITPTIQTILNEDCIAGMKAMSDESVDIIICDPPYNIGKDFGPNLTPATSNSLKWSSLFFATKGNFSLISSALTSFPGALLLIPFFIRSNSKLWIINCIINFNPSRNI